MNGHASMDRQTIYDQVSDFLSLQAVMENDIEKNRP